MTLIEVLVGIAILGGAGVLLMGFLYRNPMTHLAYTRNYGDKLSRTQLYRSWASGNPHDTLLEHRDSMGVDWTTIVKTIRDGNENCVSATSVRHGKDTTRTLYLCLYD